MSTNKSNKPELRFKGFSDDWEQRKLSDFAIKAVDNRGKTPPLSEEGTHPLIEVAALGNGHPDYSKVEKYLDDYSFRHNLRDYIKEGDILFSTVGSIGLVSLMDSHENAAIAQNIVAFRAKQGYLPKFLYSLFSTAENQERANRIVMGAVQPSIKVSQLVDVEYYVTNNIKEQRMLGEMFYNLDNLITLHQRKCDNLKIIKKSMLDNLFPKIGEKVPKWRFKGFNNDWEQRKLGDIASSFEYGLNAAAKEYDGKNKYIRITDIDDNTHGFLTDNLTSPDIHLTSADNYKLTEGDILFARTGASVGKSYIYRNSDGLVYYAGFLIRARIKEEYDAEFVFQNTLTDRYNKYIAMTSQRSGQPGVNAQEYAEFEINVPQKEEQTKIGTYFHNLDHLITLHQSEVERLKKAKQFFLDKMFI